MQEITHYVPGGWDGQSEVKAICGKVISYMEASSLFTNCPDCKIHWRTGKEIFTPLGTKQYKGI